MRFSRPPRVRTRTSGLGGRALKLIRPWAGQPVGEVINPPAAAAQILMERKIAEPVEEVIEEVAEEVVEEDPKPKRRGRPPGSKNKPKPEE